MSPNTMTKYVAVNNTDLPPAVWFYYCYSHSILTKSGNLLQSNFTQSSFCVKVKLKQGIQNLCLPPGNSRKYFCTSVLFLSRVTLTQIKIRFIHYNITEM